MKTVQNKSTGKVKREQDVVAQSLVNGGKWTYVQHFAAEGLKDANVIGRVGDPGMTFQNPLKKNKMSKAMKRHMRRTKRGN